MSFDEEEAVVLEEEKMAKVSKVTQDSLELKPIGSN